MSNLRQAAQQALEALIVSWQNTPHWQVTEAITVLKAALAEQCKCGDRAAAVCPGEWEPGCDLGENEVHAVVHEPQDDPVAEVVKAAQGVLSWTELAHRPPVRDTLETGRMVRVRLHALADLHDTLTALAAAPNKAAQQRHEQAEPAGCTVLSVTVSSRCSAYTEPPAPQRQPLTKAEVQELLTRHFDDDTMCGDDMTFVRAIEAAHGITGEQK